VTVANLEQGLGRRLARNLALQVASQGIAIVISIVTVAVLARRLEVEAFGGYTFLFTFIFFFLSFNDLGIPTTLLREITQAPARTEELVQNMLGLRLVMAAASIAVGWAVVFWLDLPPGYRLAQLVFLLILPIQAIGTQYVVLQSRIQIGRVLAAEVVNRVTGFAVMMAAIANGQGLLWVVVALVIGEAAGAALILAMTWRVVRPVPRFDTGVWRDVVRMSLPLSATTLLVAILNRVDMVLLQKMSPTADVGLTRVAHYGSAYRVPNLSERVPQMMMGTIFPMMIAFAATDVAALRRLYWKSSMQLAAIALPMVGLVTAAAPYIVRVWMGPEYAPVVPLMRVLIWASALLYVALPAANLLIALRYQRINFWIMIPATVLNVVLNLILIPRFGALGAAWATVAAYAFLAIGYLAAVAIVMPRGEESRA
jgi:O-antigen/teichoic acid export membrane protein